MKIPRRRFLVVAAGAGVAACSATNGSSSSRGGAVPCETEATGPGLGYCLVANKRLRVVGGGALAVGHAVIVSLDDNTAAIVARDAKGLYALSATCPHACCTVTLCSGAGCAAPTRATPVCDGQTPTPSPLASTGAAFLCPCHGSQFGPDGAVVSGPATRALPAVAVTIDGPDAIVDLSSAVPGDARIP